MRSTIIILSLILIGTLPVSAQKFFTRSGHVSFFSKTPMENIEAHNHQVTSIVNAATGEVAFNVLMRSFEFDKALMQEHFNEKYVHSDKFPKASFKGSIEKFNAQELMKPGTHEVTVTGELDLHGVKKTVTAKGQLVTGKDGIKGSAKFEIRLAEHNVEIPTLVKDNIADTVAVTVEMDYKPMEK